MRIINARRIWGCCLLLSIMAFLLYSTLLHASPPTRVARLSSMSGSVSFLAAGVDEWVNAVVNRPLTTWDRLWVDQNSMVKLQLGASTICVGENTSLTILNLDDRTAQFQLIEGKLNLNIQKIAPNQDYEIDTPNLAFVIQKPGNYRVDVDAEGNASITVYSGTADVMGEQVSYSMMENQALRFIGTDLSNPQVLELKKDALDLACFPPTPKTVRYISTEVVGWEDLEEHGEWIPTDVYGQVWVPAGIGADWVPYCAGEWVWIDPWGWTWIDAQPWGFAPFHYGRWAFLDTRWVWIPGPIEAIPVYAPALVEFINLENEIAWFPLGYNEIYVPPYFVTRNYFMNINISNTAILNKQIGNMYNNKKFNPSYVNMKIPNAVSAVSQAAFINGESIVKQGKRLDSAAISRGTISASPAASPVLKSITGGAKAVSKAPAANVFNKATISKKPPAAEPIPFNEKAGLLKENKGVPLRADQLKTLKAPKPAQNVKVLEKGTKGIERPTSTKPSQPVGDLKNPAVQETQGKAAQEAQDKASKEEQGRTSEAARIKAAQEAQRERAKADSVAAEAAKVKADQEAKRKAQESSEAAKVKVKQDTQGKAIQEMQNKAAEDAQRRALEAESARVRAAQEEAHRRSIEAEKLKAAEIIKQRAVESEKARETAQEVNRAAESAKAQQKAAQEAQSRAAEAVKAQEAQQRAIQESQNRAAEAARRAQEVQIQGIQNRAIQQQAPVQDMKAPAFERGKGRGKE